MRKTLLATGLSVLLLSSMWVAPPSAPTATAAAMVTGVYGGLTIDRGGTKLQGRVRMLLQAGDRVSTNDRSRAVLLLADGSQIKLQTETIVQFPTSKGLKVVEGEVFASMAHQHGPFTFQVPNGKAGVVGTDLDIQVGHASLSHSTEVVTTLTVAKGSVDFAATNPGGSGTGHAVRVASGTQSLLAHHDVKIDNAAAAFAPSEPVQVDVDPIIAWNRQVQQYSDAIARLHDQYQLLEADTAAHSGFVSPTLMEELNDDEELIKSLVPDEDFVAGHQDLLLAYHNYKLALTMTANPQLQQSSLNQANAAFAAADMALQRYKIRYQSKMQGFLQH